MGLKIHLLGRFEVLKNGKPIENHYWPTTKSKSLFKILLTIPGYRFPKETLEDLLWPNFDSGRADNNLKVTVNQLRKTLEPDLKRAKDSTYIKQSSGGYLFWPEDCEIDTQKFLELENNGRSEKNEEDVMKLYQQAIDLYKGELLPEDIHEEWSKQHREYLEARYFEILDNLIEGLYKKKCFQEAISYSEKALAANPYREEFHRMLMRCHSELGNSSLALKSYEKLRRSLNTLNVIPSQETEKLYQEIFDGVVRIKDPTPSFESQKDDLEKKLKVSQGQEKFEVLLELASVLDKLGLRDEQEKALEEAFEISQTLSVDENLAQILLQMADFYQLLGESDKAHEYGIKADKLFKDLINPVEQARVNIILGTTELDKGDTNNAQNRYNLALELLKQEWSDDAEKVKLKALANLGLVYSRRAEYRTALVYYDRALRIALRHHDLASEVQILHLMGALHFQWDHFSEARLHWEHCKDLSHRIGEFLRESQCMNNLAILLKREGNLKDAINLHKQAISIQKRFKHFNGIAQNWNNIASAYEVAGLFEDALKAYQQALPYDELIDNVLGIAMDKTNIADILTYSGQLDQSEKMLHEAIDVFISQKNRWWHSQALRRLGFVFQKREDHERAIESFQEAIRIAQEIESGHQVILAGVALAESYLELGEDEKGLEKAQEVMEQIEQVTPGDHLIESHFALYRTFDRLGEKGQALMNLNVAYRLVLEQKNNLTDSRFVISFLEYRKVIIDEWESHQVVE